MGKAIGSIAMNCGARPSDIAEIDGSALERLLFDIEVLAEVSKKVPKVGESGKMSTYDQIMARRAQSGVYT